MNRIAVVTGANRGIGLEVVRQLAAAGDTVVLGARDAAAGERAAATLGGSAAGGRVLVRQVDVTDQASLDAVAVELADRHGKVDVIVNNAAIHYDGWQQAAGADLGVVVEALDTNLVGAWRTVNTLLPLLRASAHGRIVNVSSEAGSLAAMGGGTPAYRASKAALNALTRMLASELRSAGILVNSVCPGWVATDMGGPGGRPVQEGAASVVWAIDLPDDGPSGGFYRDGAPLPLLSLWPPGPVTDVHIEQAKEPHMDISLEGWDIQAAHSVDWVPWGTKGNARAKILGSADGYMVTYVQADAGYEGDPHVHGHPEFFYLLEGSVRNQGREMSAGDGYAAAANSTHADFATDTGATYIVIFKI